MKPNRLFGVLYDKMYRIDILYEAWRKVRSNKGSAGIDRETIEYIEDTYGVKDFLKGIQDKLRCKSYKPLPVQRVYIPKPDGSQRPLGIPTVTDRVVQTAMKLVIEPIFEAKFKDFSYGFRPKRDCKKAILEIRKYLVYGHRKVVDADIKSYFDSIDHDKLIKTVKTVITDKSIVKLISLWLNCGVMEEMNLKKQITGTPQGGVISPLLANLYLHWLDNYWEKSNFSKRYGAHLIRYADDFVILCKANAEKYLQIVSKFLERLGLKLHESKTKVIDLEESQTFDFLGCTFKFDFNKRIKNSTRKTVFYYPSIKSVKSVKAKLRNIIKISQHCNLTYLCREKLNPILRGWSNYYIHGNSKSVFFQVDNYCIYLLCIMLRKKHSKRSKGWRDHPPSFFYDTLHGLYYMSRSFVRHKRMIGGYF